MKVHISNEKRHWFLKLLKFYQRELIVWYFLVSTKDGIRRRNIAKLLHLVEKLSPLLRVAPPSSSESYNNKNICPHASLISAKLRYATERRQMQYN